jgi:cellulose synthase/poly-beta-1,6-N-acetylglucosamine synthase-like glycosyltransferase
MILTSLAIVVVAFFSLPILSDLLMLLQVAAGRARRPMRTTGTGARLLYLIPAHNEGRLVEACIRSVRRQLYPADRLAVVVVADNCTDNTASAAVAAGAELIERFEPEKPGKPAALAWAFQHLNVMAFDAVVVLDADSIVDPRHAASLDKLGVLRKKVLEGFIDVRNKHDSALTRMATVFAAARFRSAYRLKQLAGINVPLSNGICIGTDILRAFPWRARSLSEDCEVYARLTALGVPIQLAADARIYAQETRTLRQASSQRARWLPGRIDVLRRVWKIVLRSRAIGWHQKLDTMAELAVPGPAFQAGVCGVVGAALLLIDAPAGGLLAGLLTATLVRPAAYAVIGVRLDPDPAKAAASFAFLPVYTVWRCLVAIRSAGLLFGSTSSIRTTRR